MAFRDRENELGTQNWSGLETTYAAGDKVNVVFQQAGLFVLTARGGDGANYLGGG
eukprot:gene2493-837_t